MFFFQPDLKIIQLLILNYRAPALPVVDELQLNVLCKVNRSLITENQSLPI